MYKPKKSSLFGLVLGLVFSLLTGCGSNLTKSSRAWLDLYEETPITFEGIDDPSLLSWKSGDESIAMVENATIIAKSVGETTVSSSLDGTSYVIDVKVFDSGSVPSIKVDRTTFYVNASANLSPYISYNGNSYYPELEYRINIDNSNVARSSGSVITGVSEGITNARVATTYKGNNISKSFIITVKPNSYVELVEDGNTIDEVTLYATSNNKFSSKVLTYNLIDNGEVISNPEMNYRIENSDLIKIEDNTVLATKEGSTLVHASYANNASISIDFKVNVKPNYVEGSFNNDVSASYGATYTPYSGTIGSRSGDMMKYYNGDYMRNDETGSYWNHRLVNDHASTNAIEAYRNLGFRYFAFDIYMEKEARPLLLLDGLSTTFYVPYDTYFQNEIVQVIDENGNYINKFVKQQWLTIVYDIKARIEFEPDSTLNCYLALNADGLNTYIMNVRYYLDSSFLPFNPIEYSKVSDDEIKATNDEFVKLHDNSNTYKKVGRTIDGVSNPHLYQTNSANYSNDSLIIATSTGSSKNDSIVRLQEKGKYLAFDLYLEKASNLYFAINNKRLSFKAEVGITNFYNCSWITLFSDNKLEYEINLKKWYTVFIDYGSDDMIQSYLNDPNVLDPVFIEFNTCDKGDTAYINNIRYLQSDSIVPSEFAKPLITSSKSSIIVNKNETFEIDTKIINGTKPGELKYQIANENIVSKTSDESIFKATSTGLTTITITCEDLLPLTISVRVIEQYDYYSNAKAYYREEGISGLDEYATFNHLTISRDEKEMPSSSIVRFDFKVLKPITYLYLLDTAGFGDASLNATRIGPNEYSAAEWWGAYPNGANDSILSITDTQGNILGKFGKDGINFEVGKTYSVYYSLNSNRFIDIYVSNQGLIKAKEDFYWGNSDYSYLSKVSDYIDVTNIGGVYSDITPVISSASKDQTCYLGQDKDLEFDTIFGNNKKLTYNVEDESVLEIVNGKIHPKKVGKSLVTISIEGGNSISITVSVNDGYIDIKDKVILGEVGNTTSLDNQIKESSTEKNITYTISDSSIASINGSSITFLKKGFARIEASAPGCETKTIDVRVLSNDKALLNDGVTTDSSYPGGQRLLFKKSSNDAQSFDTVMLTFHVKELFSYLYILDRNDEDPSYAQYENGVKVGNGNDGSMYQGFTSWWVPSYTAGFDSSRLNISSNGKVLGYLGSNPSPFNHVGEGFAFTKGNDYTITIDLANSHTLILLLANFMKNKNDGNDHEEVCGGNIGNYMLKADDYISITNIYGVNKRS